ncbi:MAG: 50S ribosomal protein L2 [Methanopyraceae archaeon]
MGKRIRPQRLGRGSPTYRAPSHRYRGRAGHRPYDEREKEGKVVGKVVELLHDPARNAPVARVRFEDGEERLVLVPEGTKVGDTIECGVSAEIKPGNTLPLAEIPEGVPIFNIEGRPGDGGKFARAPGCYATIVAHDVGRTYVQLPSGKVRAFDPRCRATIGVMAGGGKREKPFVKAGKKYHHMRSKGGKWPKVRGVAMNAVDHPFGGGNHQSPGKPTTVARGAPPGQKVGHIAARKTGRGGRR